jgi:hypothetical protein
MPTPDQNPIVLAQEKLRLFLILTEEILSKRQELDKRLVEVFGTSIVQDTMRNRVLIGLNLKALDSFERLFVDARERRAESAHHLKTMVECFMYSHWVSADPSEDNAKLLCAEAYRSRANYHENCCDSVEDRDQAVEWRRLQQKESIGIESKWKEFKDKKLLELAAEAKLEDHYHKIYRLACEAAHMGDLFVYMPPQPQEAELTISTASMFRAYTSLKFGIILACDLLHDASDSLRMEMDQQIERFRERQRTIQAMGS